MPKNPHKAKCTEKTKSGEPCKAYATVNGLCSSHAKRNVGAGAPKGNDNRLIHGFYGRHFTMQEVADLVAHAQVTGLDDEIALTRVLLQRVMKVIGETKEESIPTEEFQKLANLIFSGTNNVARLLRTQRAISGEAADGIAGAIGDALDELSTLWGIDL